MSKRIEAHVEELFAGAPHHAKVLEIKEELLANLRDKYDDLLAGGKSGEEAYSLVVSSIGDIEDLLAGVTQAEPYSLAELEKKRQVKAVFLSVGVAIYVLSLAVLFLFEQFGLEDVGMVVMMLFCAVATGLIVYGVNAGKISYEKRDDTFVEQYKERVVESERTRNIKSAVNSTLWILIVVIYLAVSFITRWWSYTWIIFLIGAFLQQLAFYFLTEPAKRRSLWHGLIWTITTAVYFIISFATRGWAWTWMIFLISLAAQQIIRLIALWRNEA